MKLFQKALWAIIKDIFKIIQNNLEQSFKKLKLIKFSLSKFKNNFQ